MVFNLLFFLSVITIGIVVARKYNPSPKMTIIQTISYTVTIGVGVYFMNSNYGVYADDLDCSFNNPNLGSHALNVLKVMVYFFTTIGGYLNTANALLYLGGNGKPDDRKKSVSFYLWFFLLLALAVGISEKYHTSIPNYILLAIFVWKTYNNCRSVWPKVQYPIIVAILGVVAGFALFSTIIHTMRGLLLLIFYAAVLIVLLKNPSVLFSSSDSGSFISTSSIPNVQDDPEEKKSYDAVIKGGGSLGDDIGANRNLDGSLTDENGSNWKNDGYGNYTRTD